MINQEELIKLINKEEGYEVEFKESLAGLKTEDVVAFANSISGGVILIGVKDDVDTIGRQLGTIVGCPISDNGKLSILNKAQSCRPPVNLEITAQDINGQSIYILEIPSGDFKPYCTDGGTYRIRGDGQKRSLYPNELLSLFMESERNKFIDSFKEATRELEQNLNETKTQVLRQTSSLIKELQLFDKKISEALDDIYSTADGAESNSSSVESTVSDIEDTVDEIWGILTAVAYLIPRIDSGVGNRSSTEFDPRLFLKESLSRYVKRLRRDGHFSERLIERQIKLLRRVYPEVNKHEIEQIIKEINASKLVEG
ncbi:AlbA family DNA-binding domain-containing protein [Paenibacillus sp. 2TAB19]|uniref:AlbA family DNA-binding domain-containing protein n=1 Tax=Paenibacillus sp. 2TAB19 TaxID=3233003 RepID=UPI003F9DFD14